MAPPDRADGSPDTGELPASETAEAAQPVTTGEPGKLATGLRPLTAVLAPVARTLQRLRPERQSRQVAGLGPADAAGAVLARLTVLPALLLLAWLVPGVPLLLGHAAAPVPLLLISVPLAVVLLILGLRVVPACWPRLRPPERTAEPAWATWLGLLATVVVVAGLMAWQLTKVTEALIVVRDPGTYLQAGYWIAQHGSLPVPENLPAFGGPHAGLNFASTGFPARGSGIYPAVTPGLPLVLAGGFWAQGIAGATALGPILGGLAVLAFAGLVARLVGPQWAPAGALLLGFSMPQQYIGRTTLSETALQIVLFGGLSLLADSVSLRRAPSVSGWLTVAGPGDKPGSRLARAIPPEHALAVLAGLSLGFGLVVSLDALPYLVATIPFGCALIVGRRPQAIPFPMGIALGVSYGLLGCFLLDRPFLDSVGQTAALAGVVAVWLIALSAVATQLSRLSWVQQVVPRALAARPLRWAPLLGAVVVVAALIGLFVRPYVAKVRGRPTAAAYDFIAALQHQQGLPADPARTYAEQTLYWLVWYIGLPTVLLGAFGIALVVRRTGTALLTWRDPAGVWRMWALPVAIVCAGTAAVLWSPDIMPDQPWASRRLVVFAIPGLVLCGLWAASWLTRLALERGARPVTAGVAGVFCFAAMLLPTVSTTFGLGVTHSTKTGGLRMLIQEGMARGRIGIGESGAVRAMCSHIPRNASVLILGWPTAAQYTQVVRGMCGVPTAWMSGQDASAVGTVTAAIAAAGRQPVLLAGSARQLAAFGGSPEPVLDLVTTADPHQLTQVPTSPQNVRYELWMTEPGAGGAGA